MSHLQKPLYLQVFEDIKEKIKNRIYNEGDKLPSERQLAEEYEVSRITIREALKHLEEHRFLRTEHGRGSYVLGNQYNQMLDKLYSFKDEIEKNGDTPSTMMLSIEPIDPPTYVQQHMGLTRFQKVYKLRRLRLSNDTPLIYETTYLPLHVCEGLDQFDFNQHSLYETLHDYYNIAIDYAYETLTSRKMSEQEASYLETDKESVCMFIERHSYVEDKIVEFTESVAKAQDYKYTVKLIQQ
ncbi:GntR family transcriptional regulator [Staphylococcus sp. SQ8-PEA]|uniref:GntR family transcriptional regulator n=1 Tax=Staphylococcus marylandisciuri TaxID=2981529 RepID=A0ABT2QQQ5_9STAP|nr:GntR family transcriptional regulator [Staphylococcus marylandisciuri]MCU5746317.1 GntR family transcriptional regulator [Staphylococcus marylandisciuri]